ncbi:NADPH:quinone reductase [Actinacidiphila yanglinensis]|uniref:NADPH:quinone reductase n=1 Tax=Actinacidiphila yanglinensis TaxID=310779 RepID=A0A1H5T0M9_9ACTN|nr:NADP-dependent oxidoreductase [Actinacidiphila yanglinensis]SEF56350.1 NADPH:quinone reductase [Actinacidiphila yanglinensis]
MTTASTPLGRARAVRFDRYGGREVLDVRDVPMPRPGEGEVLVEVRAAAINPGETTIRSGALHDLLPATFPSGQGSDLAGIVRETGPGIREFGPGDAVLGFSWTRSSHATHTVVPAAQLLAKPEALPWEVAGALSVAGPSAYAAIQAVDPHPGEAVAVSGATGGVGTLVVQLLARRGVTVLGIASAASAGWLSAHGAIPVAYGDGVGDRLRAAAPRGIDAFIDLFGPEYVRLAVGLGVKPDRVDTIVPSSAAVECGVRQEGAAVADTPAVLRDLSALLASGAVELPIAATYPLDRVADAFEELERRHTRGKIVLLPQDRG